MANYIKTKVLNYSTVELNDDNRIVVDYSTINVNNLNIYINTRDDSIFGFKLFDEGQTLEKASYDLYGTPNYWDLLLLINRYEPLFDTVFTYDTLVSISEDKTEELNSLLFNGLLPVNIKSHIQDNYYKKYSKRNEINRVLKYIKPEHVNKFLSEGLALGYLS